MLSFNSVHHRLSFSSFLLYSIMASSETTNTANTDPTAQVTDTDTENPTTRSDEKRFSSLVERHSCLYINTNSSKHANKRKEAWKKVTEDYGSGESIEEIKKKWLNIRTTYGRYLKANSDSIKTTKDIKGEFRHLDFISSMMRDSKGQQYIQPASTTSTTTTPSTQEDISAASPSGTSQLSTL